MLVTWIVAAGIIILAQLATRKIKPIPDGPSEFLGMARGKSLQFSRRMIGRSVGPKNLLVLRHHLHLHSFLELVRAASRRRHDWVGPSRSSDNGFQVDPPVASWRECGSEPHLCHGLRLLRLLDRLGHSGQWVSADSFMHLFGPEGRHQGVLKILMIFIFFIVGWLEIVSILFRPISLSFPIIRQHLCRRNHARINEPHRAVAGLADSDSILLSGAAGRASCRRSSSCF